ncbi:MULTISPECIES: signal peptidase I [unclassified Mesorhizobium]|uniref:signal peptidase I n=1 Tax=unclassified Mesorhizobium TaxID=325217 RepID=UPI001FD874EA|nr:MULTISPECIES: signal peptidase I [unclassified Mesorhizobium]
MTNETAAREPASRSRWSTALVSAFGGPFGGFLWIGSGRLAVASLMVFSAIFFACVYTGFPVLPGVDLGPVANLSSIGLMLLSVGLVVPFTRRFKPDKWFAHGLWVLVLVFLTTYPFAFSIRAFLFQPFSTPSGSMEPTLVEGDYFFVSKFAYGYGRYSVPFGLLPVDGRIFGAEPRRGDIMVFRVPTNPDIDYVKRLIGLPGDRIQMIDGVLHINGVAVKLEAVGDYSSEEVKSAKLQREILPEGVSYLVIDLADNSVGDNTREFVVPVGEYFTLGDNRDNSNDSRFQMGLVPYENLVGKAVRLFWNSRGVEYSSRQTLDGSAAK